MKGISPLPTTGHVGFSTVLMCRAEAPWDGVQRAGQRVRHPDARPDPSGQPDVLGTVSMLCPHCGARYAI